MINPYWIVTAIVWYRLALLFSMHWRCDGETVCRSIETHIAPSIAWSKDQRHLQDLDPVQEADHSVRTIVECAIHSLCIPICQIQGCKPASGMQAGQYSQDSLSLAAARLDAAEIVQCLVPCPCVTQPLTRAVAEAHSCGNDLRIGKASQCLLLINKNAVPRLPARVTQLTYKTVNTGHRLFQYHRAAACEKYVVI